MSKQYMNDVIYLSYSELWNPENIDREFCLHLLSGVCNMVSMKIHSSVKIINLRAQVAAEKEDSSVYFNYNDCHDYLVQFADKYNDGIPHSLTIKGCFSEKNEIGDEFKIYIIYKREL